VPRPRSRSQTWRTFLRNQAYGIGLTKPFAAREVADRLILPLRSRLRRAERPARYAGESLSQIARLLIGRLPRPWLQTSPAPDLDHRRESSGLNSAVTARRRFRVGFNPHRPAIARIRASPLGSRTLRYDAAPKTPSLQRRAENRGKAFTSRRPTSPLLLQATGRTTVDALSIRNLKRTDSSPIQTRMKF
jgi:hypothetical protein